MCTHSRYIFNPYSRRKVLVKCGKCEACLQEKACARANRIRNNVTSGTIALFITLTYTNDYIPYVLRSDLQSDALDIPVYRRASCRFTYSRSHGYRFKKYAGISCVDKVFVPHELRCDSSVKGLIHLRGLSSEHIGVCFYNDFQNFIKRLRQILQRNYNYEKTFSYFSCSEYGAHTFRPHFHALLFIRKDDEKVFRDAIAQAWPYADYDRTQKFVEIARDAASYVSSYVNSHIGLDSIMSLSDFSPQHSYSKHFGVVLDCFNLDKILQKIDRGDLHYYSARKFDGETSVASLPIPTYVLNRWFPKFKGFGRIPLDALQRILLDPSSTGFELQSGQQNVRFKDKLIPLFHAAFQDNPLYMYTPKETYQIYVMLDNAFYRFRSITGLNRYDFMYYYIRCWNVHSSNVFKDSFDIINEVSDFSDFYENAVELVNGFVSSPTLPDLEFQLNPDDRIDVKTKHANMIDIYHKLDKSKKVVNYCMSHMGYYI